MRLLTESDFPVSSWSGGHTVQLAIAPEGVDYGKRDFLWRVSSATVELDESDFTALPDYERWIMPLSGKMRLTHNGGAAVDLAEYEAHRFDGSDRTHSWGQCTDFNLMLRKGRCRGNILALRGAAGEDRAFTAQGCAVLLYCVKGAASITANGERLALGEREAAQISAGEADTLGLSFTLGGCLAVAQVRAIG